MYKESLHTKEQKFNGNVKIAYFGLFSLLFGMQKNVKAGKN